MNHRRASLYLIAGGCMWGVYWIPLLYLEDLGLSGASAGIALYVTCLLVLLPAIWKRRADFSTHWRALLFSGLLTGCAFSLYTTSLAYTDVIRSILLFYLTPVWGTLIGLMFLKERLSVARLCVLFFAFLGLYTILGNETGLPLPRNKGDVMALLSGLFWSIGSLGLLRAQQVPIMRQIISFLAGNLVISLISLVVIGDFALLSTSYIGGFYLFGFLLCFAAFAIPMFWLTLVPARVLSPARVGILLMSEVVIGALSAMLFSGQPFGMPETFGTIFILIAAATEVIGTTQPPQQIAQPKQDKS